MTDAEKIEAWRKEVRVDPGTGYLYRVKATRRTPAGARAEIKDRRYFRVRLLDRQEYAHVVVFALTHGHIPEQVDHVNRKKEDNRPANLRPASPCQNNWNKEVTHPSSTGVRGLMKLKDRPGWVARVRVRGDRLTRYGTDRDALEAWLVRTRAKHHGEFAYVEA